MTFGVIESVGKGKRVGYDMRQTILTVLQGERKRIKRDFEKTVQTWNNKPDFDVLIDPNRLTLIVGTNDLIYKFVDGGTKPHKIRPKGDYPLRFKSNFKPLKATPPKTGYVAKTKPQQLRSGQSNTPLKHDVAFFEVNHPGTKARRFTQLIQKRSQKRLKRAFIKRFKRDTRKAYGL